MFIVKIPREKDKKCLPSHDFYGKPSPETLKGIVHQKGNLILVSPLLEQEELASTLERHPAIFPLRKDKEGRDTFAIAFDRTLVYQAEEFLKHIHEPALLLPEDVQALKESASLVREKLFSYVSDFLDAPNHERFKASPLHEFKEKLEQETAFFKTDVRQNALPFFDVDTKEEYDFMAKNVDRSRIAKKDRQTFGQEKKSPFSVQENLEMEM